MVVSPGPAFAGLQLAETKHSLAERRGLEGKRIWLPHFKFFLLFFTLKGMLEFCAV